MRRTLALGLGLVVSWLVLALGSACEYPPRVAWCREPENDFSGVTDVRVLASWGRPTSVHVVATGTELPDCVEVSSTLFVSGTAVHTTRANVRAEVLSGTLSTSPVYHPSPFGELRVVVSALGRTVEAPVPIPGARDGGAPDR